MNEITARAELQRIDREITKLRQEAVDIFAHSAAVPLLGLSHQVNDAFLVNVNQALAGMRARDQELLTEALQLFHEWQHAPFFEDADEWRTWAQDHWRKVVAWRRRVIEPDAPCSRCEGSGWEAEPDMPTECQQCGGTGVQK